MSYKGCIEFIFGVTWLPVASLEFRLVTGCYWIQFLMIDSNEEEIRGYSIVGQAVLINSHLSGKHWSVDGHAMLGNSALSGLVHRLFPLVHAVLGHCSIETAGFIHHK